MSHPRVLLVEDDATVRQFVLKAVQSLELDVSACANADQARLSLAQGPFDLLITDLVLPDGSGLELVKEVLADGGTRRPKVVVYSGCLYASMREQLTALGVWRNLVKPSSQAEIEACVREALHLADWPDGPAVAQAVATGLLPHELAAIETYFDGDREFYQTFRVSCVEQFVVDVREGDAACLAHDAPTLRRTAHSLKSVLQTLGYADHSVCSRAVEQAAYQDHWEEAVQGWQDLRQRLINSFQLTP